MLNRYSKGSILLKKNITRKGYRFETNYEFPLSYNDTEITITLSNMTLSDCAACYHLGEQLFEFSPSLSRTFDKYVVIGCYSSASEYCFVAKHDDRIIGFLLGSIIEKSNSNYGYLNWVAVEPSYQRKGVGTVMVDFIEKKMVEEDKIEMILVDTPKTNIKAIRFLEQFGFTNPTEQVYLTYTFSNASSVNSSEHSLLTSISTSSIPTLSFTPAINHQHNGNHNMPGSSATSADESNRTLLQKRKEPENGDTNGHTNTTHSSEEEKNPPKSVKLDEFATPHPPSSSIPPRIPLSDEIIIRPINLDDIWPVFLVGEMAFTSQRPNLYRFWDESQVLDAYETDSDLSLVAEYKGEIVGFALGSTLERADTKFGYLIWLGVSTALQGRNIGRKLYNEYEKLIRKEGINTIIVDTQSTNVDAIRFFERIGFRVQEEFYYYSKSLKQPDEDELNSESSVTSTTSD